MFLKSLFSVLNVTTSPQKSLIYTLMKFIIVVVVIVTLYEILIHHIESQIAKCNDKYPLLHKKSNVFLKSTMYLEWV